jgi:hypothetical protein
MTVQYAIYRLMAVGVLVGSGYGLGVGAHPAAADERQDPPVVQSLRLEGSEAYVTFVDNSDEARFRIVVVTKGEDSRTVASVEVPPNPGNGRVVTRQVSGMPAGQAVCAGVSALGPDPAPGSTYRWTSQAFDQACADPANVPSDVALQNIRGNANPQAGASPAYLVALRNAGGADATGVTVNVSTSGVATLGDQAGVAGGWAANGFSCSGGGSALTCTGGNLKKGEETAPAVIVKFTGPGLGAIHAQISGAGDTNAGNNGTALNLTVG